MAQRDAVIWRDVLSHVREHHPDLCRQWFEEIEPLGVRGGVFELLVNHDVRRKYLQRSCADAFNEALQSVTERLLTVRFQGPDDRSEAQASAPAIIEAKSPSSKTFESNGAASGARGRAADEIPFHPDYTFDQFVVGPNNRLAHAAAQAIADRPGRAYNPMFIHGDVGLGKTHLLQAVCLQVLERQADTRILYIACEAFITRFMESVQAGHMTQFRHEFRDVDVLVIDDVHFLADRDRTQDEFFHTFNTLYQSDRQIILSSDAPPDEIPNLEKRLVSRFKWGMVAQIHPPDYETRAAIVQQKAASRGVSLPDDVSCLIAQCVSSNIRELEGALTQVQHMAQVERTPITPDIARRALGAPESSGVRGTVTFEMIVAVVTDHFSVPLNALQGKRRQRSIALPRQICMYLARKFTRFSLEEIGGWFGGRDHTTVLHAVRTITAQRESNLELDRLIEGFERALRDQIGG